ncbi:MAG: hypothetical protein JO362_13765 [Streptomycetaceae bacterium]|nr:hypothetical protein [Streptomycetaceae bacterium]
MIVLDCVEAEHLLSVLIRLDDWLLHAQPDTLEDMVEFFGPKALGQKASESIIDFLDHFSAELGRLMPAGSSPLQALG